MPHTFFLVPGYGAQGGAADDVAPGFDKNGLGAIVNSSRGIMCAWQKEGVRRPRSTPPPPAGRPSACGTKSWAACGQIKLALRKEK